MYLRRHCYDKPHRCPGWAGGGMRNTFHDTKPEYWGGEGFEDYDFETSNSRRRHWWESKNRCKGGSLWDLFYEDPFWMWRWHHCYVCDVVAIPSVVRWLDPTWVWWDFRTGVRNWFWDMRRHKDRWVDGTAPWWSLPDAIWKSMRHVWFNTRYRTGDWFKKLYKWYAPSKRQERDATIAEQRKHYFRDRTTS